MFSNAIVRAPGKSLIDGLTDSKHLGSPDYQKAITQHKAYINALQSCGLEVHVLESCEDYPDSTFVEDVALITPKCAIFTRPVRRSRLTKNKSISIVKIFIIIKIREVDIFMSSRLLCHSKRRSSSC